ncbi:hypothetical protein BDZ89DRAFT_1148838 [Hymenopellis radicata]|nr:hypothetical protein BDZ89DRAFT_1148838 [Hymenopellis radicata]
MDASLPASAAALSAAPAIAAIAPDPSVDEIMAALLSSNLLTATERAQILALPPPIHAALLDKIAASRPNSTPIVQASAIKLPMVLPEARTPVSVAKAAMPVPSPPKPTDPLPEPAVPFTFQQIFSALRMAKEVDPFSGTYSALWITSV